MDLLIDFDVWYGGRFVVNPKHAYPSIVYIGGTKHEFKKVEFDRFHFTELYSLYKLCGGNRVNVRFYYRIPGIVIEHGLVCISGDREVSDMYAKYKDSDLVTIWIEETMPLPEMVLDPQGNSISPQEFFISEPVGYLDKCQETPLVDTDPDKIEHGFPNLVNFEQAENEVKSAHVDHNSPNNNIEHDSPILSEFEPNHPLSAENDLLHAENTSAHVGPQVSDNFHESAPEFDPLSTEIASHEPQPSSGPFGGDIEEMISDFSEFDDSSDENYVVASKNSESDNDSSEVPSEFLEDLDEDIFAESVSVGWEATRKKNWEKTTKERKKWAKKERDCLSDVVVNNLCESFNSYILDARDKPIITMLECIRNKLMKRIQQKKVGMDRYIGEICPNIMRRINKNQKFSRNFFAIYSGENEYQIQCLSTQRVLSQYVVDLNKKTCTCGMFQLCGYPCAHACTAIGDNRQKLEDYVHIYYNKSEYLKIYSHMIHAVPGQADYCKTQCEPLNAPVYKTKKGRPQRMRRREADEGGSSLSTRKGLTHTCSKCLELGHNIATCKNQIHPKSKLYKGAAEQGNEIPETRTSRAPKQAPKRPSRQVPNTNPHQSSAGPSMTNSKIIQQAKSFPQAYSRANTQSSAMESTSASVIARARGIATGEDSSKATVTAAIRGSTQGRSASSGSSAHIGEKIQALV